MPAWSAYYTDTMMFGATARCTKPPWAGPQPGAPDMAGIGFELRRMLRKNTLLGLLQAYAYASVIGSGPWVFSIVGILLVGIFSASVVVPIFW